MLFNEAFRAVWDGQRIARAAWNIHSEVGNSTDSSWVDTWNGEGEWVVAQRGYPEGIPINANTAQATGIAEGTVLRFAPYLMRHSRGVFRPWLPGQDDLFADDWAAARHA